MRGQLKTSTHCYSILHASVCLKKNVWVVVSLFLCVGEGDGVKVEQPTYSTSLVSAHNSAFLSVADLP